MYYGGDHSFARDGHGANVAAYTFTGLTPGRYCVSATWRGDTNRATNTPFTILDGAALPTGVGVVNRTNAAGQVIGVTTIRQFDVLVPLTVKGRALATAMQFANRTKSFVKNNRFVWKLVKSLRKKAAAPAEPAED